MEAQRLLPPDWGTLLSAARRGDVAARDALWGRYRPWLRILAQTQLGRRLAGKFDASDVAQQALLEACRALPQFRGRSEVEFLAWLRQVLAHALAHEVRRYEGTGKRDVGREVSIDRDLQDSSLRLAAVLAAPGPSPSGHAVDHEQQLRLADILARLPDEYREVIVLRNLDGLAHEEVAARMGRSVGAVRMLWVRALARLREEMGR